MALKIVEQYPPLPEGVGGYARLSAFMGSSPEHAIFRRFGALNARNLLYMQAELVTLEKRLNEITLEDSRSPNCLRQLYDLDWFDLSQSGDNEEGNPRQWEIARKIRGVLKEYNHALIQQSTMWRISKPNRRDLNFLRQWMEYTTMGSVFLIGADSDSWTEHNAPELLALHAEHCEDVLSSWISNSVIRKYHHHIGRFFKKPEYVKHAANTVNYSQSAIASITHFAALGLSSLLPLLSIIILNLLPRMSQRIGVVAAFTVLFSLALGLVMNARNVDILAASAA